MKITLGKISLLLVLLALLSGVIACQSDPASSLDESAIRLYADPATETTLQGLSENNLTKYTRHANSEFKAAITEELLSEAANQIDSQLGTYVSKEFLRISEQDGYINVQYKAKYTKGEVGIRMVFDQDQLIAGQWFD